mgnify:CR=1 FL=1
MGDRTGGGSGRRSVLITGAGSGIGRTSAHRFEGVVHGFATLGALPESTRVVELVRGALADVERSGC